MEPMTSDPKELKRIELQNLLETIIGSRNVYYQPPASFKMKYPCIRYELDRYSEQRADNILYANKTGYQVTYVSQEPTFEIPSKIHELPYCRFLRAYVADNLNHYAYLLYF